MNTTPCTVCTRYATRAARYGERPVRHRHPEDFPTSPDAIAAAQSAEWAIVNAIELPLALRR